MTYLHKAFMAKSVCCLALSAAFLAGCATLDQNMAASMKEHVVPGKEMHVANRATTIEFCEVALDHGTSPGERGRRFLQLDRHRCLHARNKFAQILRTKAQDHQGRPGAGMSSSTRARHWMFDELRVYEAGDERNFGGIKMIWMGVVPVEAGEGGRQGPLQSLARSYRSNQYLKFNKGSTVYLLDMPDGKVFVMQSWTNFTQKERDGGQPQGSGQPVQAVAAGLEVPGRRCSTAT